MAILDLTFLVNATYLQAIWSAFAVVALVYSACFALYFGIARSRHLRQIRVVAA